MKRLFAFVLALAMVCCLAGCGSSNNTASADGEKVTFTMGIDPEYPPFSYLGDNGQYTGFDVEVCAAACELLGWDLHVFAVNWH